MKTFEEAYNDVINDVKEERINEEINNIIKKFKKKLDDRVEFIKISDLLKMDNRFTKKINREDVINQGFSLEFTNKIFESKKNTIHESETSDKYYIVKVESDSEINFDNEKFNNVKNSVNKIYGIENFQQITKILENKYPVMVNKSLFNDFIDRLQY